MRDGALTGVTVIEWSEMVAGPYCGKLLASLGAEVIKVEKPRTGDCARWRGPFCGDIPGPERSALFLYLNTGKLGITLDPTRRTGAELLKKLLMGADVFIEDRKPGSLKAIGLDPEVLCKLNPRLIHASVTPFGQSGPYAQHKAYDLNIFHAGGEGCLLPSGLSWEMHPEREPVKGGGHLADYQSGLTVSVGIAAALLARQRDGAGQWLDVSKQEAQLALNHMSQTRFVNGELETRALRQFTYGGVVPCKDGYVEILTLEDHMWRALVKAMGDPEWAGDSRFSDPISRARHGAEINQHLRRWAAEYGKEELYQMLQAQGVPIGVYCTSEDLVRSRHLACRNFLMEIDHPEVGRQLYPDSAFRLPQSPATTQRRAPLLREHNRQVYCERLGLTLETVARMAEAGIV